MLKRLLRTLTPIIILIGTLLVVLGVGWVEGATVIQTNSINYGSFTWTYKTFDFHLYLNNLQESITNLDIINGIIPNNITMPKTPSASDILGWFKFLVNILLIWLANAFIYILNWVTLAPIKVILYPVNIVLTVLGINTTNSNYLNILINIYNFQIPFLPYL